MFEKNIQKSWENYQYDSGLGRIALVICTFNVFLFVLCLALFSTPIYEIFLPIAISLGIILYQEKISNYSCVCKFLILAIFVSSSIIIDYYFIGVVDRIAGGFRRYDTYFSLIDDFILGDQSAKFFYDVFSGYGLFSTVLYDFLQISYMTYFLFPFLGGIFYFKQLNERNKYKISRYVGSITILFILNYFFYLLVPVSGPQYHDKLVQNLDLPLSIIGKLMNNLVFTSHPTFIDCFPSGHVGIAFLVTFWMFKIRNHYRYIFLIFFIGMFFATLSLKYHYLFDVLVAIPFSYSCIYISYLLIPIDIEKRHNSKWRI
jgi:hypothetical protein